LGIGDWGLGIGDWAQSPIPTFFYNFLFFEKNLNVHSILFLFLFIYINAFNQIKNKKI
jgi:hypothetical protein